MANKPDRTAVNGAPPSRAAERQETTRAGALYLVHVLTHATRAQLDGLLTTFGLSSFQYTILSVIERNEGLSSAALSRRFHVTPQAMGEVILLLEKRGLVSRVEDRRNRKVLHLSLTPAGLEVVAKAQTIVADFERRVFAGHSSDALETFRDFVSSTLTTIRNGR